MIKFYMRKNREREKMLELLEETVIILQVFGKLGRRGEKSKSNFFTKVAFTKILIGISF